MVDVKVEQVLTWPRREGRMLQPEGMAFAKVW